MQRKKVVDLYKNLLFIGKTYPIDYNLFKSKLHNAFMKKKDIIDPTAISKAVDHGWFVYKELEALWFLRKYRAMKKRYNDREGDDLATLEKKFKEMERKES